MHILVFLLACGGATIDAPPAAPLVEMAETRTVLKATTDTPADAVALGKVLQEHGDRLIAGCTMEGAAHDELHVFLMAWFPEVTAIRATKDVNAGRASVEKLRALIVEYDRFFE